MADGAELSFDWSQVDREADQAIRSYLSAGTRTIANVTRRAEQRLEQLTRDAAGGNLWRAWQSSVYPKGGRPAKDPAGEIWVKGRARTAGAIKYWTEPGAIRGRNVEFLPIPLPVAGRRNGKGILSPTEWLNQHPDWRLDLAWREGKRPLLVAHRRQKRRADWGTAVRPRRGAGIVDGQPIFALVRVNPFRNAVAVAPVIRLAEAEIPSEYALQVRSSR